MTVRELREKYLAFFESKGHVRFPSGSLIPYDVTGRLDESLLFNGAGMIQFKPYFRGAAQPENKRLTTAQKCVRTGDIDEVGDSSHLTFFEMMGNFSFGDYFKVEAIRFSWEFLTSPQWLGLDPKRLAFTIFEDDDDAYNTWAELLSAAGVDPKTRVFRLGEETNYWPAGAFSKGPPGPCGPNSEMFYWVSNDVPPPSAPYDREDFLRDDDLKNWLEIWNDVFIQYEWQGSFADPAKGSSGGYIKEGMPNLPFLSIDTGMGLERTAAVLGGYKSVYDTDAFSAIFAKIDEISQDMGAASGAKGEGAEEHVLVARRIIADHIRTACFCIADGILPANNGRGYVLRRLIRRAVLKGQRVLGFDDLFMYKVYEGIVENMGDFYTELVERREIIVETLKNEEALFRRTLRQGVDVLTGYLTGDATDTKLVVDGEARNTLVGSKVFFLYDSLGFPLEVTKELCAEMDWGVDEDGYEAAMKEAQDRSRGAQNREEVYGGVTAAEEVAVDDAPSTTTFLGYSEARSSAKIVRVRTAGPHKLKVALDHTPFYGESGGQVGDRGFLEVDGQSLVVSNTTKSSGTFWHDVESDATPMALLGKEVFAVVESPRRARIIRNHTATHLLHAALRSVLGTHVTQAGSYVGPDNLRFDFTHGKAMTPEEIAQVELIVNMEALKNIPVTTYADLPIAEAKAKGAMALFGEKYGDTVRMVEIGEFSRELCGGIHVRSTAEIGMFKIVSENSAASGVRRIEAITGEATYQLVLEETSKIKEAAQLLKTTPRELLPSLEKTLESLKEERKKREKAEMAAISGKGSGEATETVEIKGVQLWVKNLGSTDQKVAAQVVDNAAAEKPNQVTLGAVNNEGKISFMCKVGPEAQAKGAHAGNLIREVAKIAGGGGGGQAAFATAGGKIPEKIDEALASAAATLESMIKD